MQPEEIKISDSQRAAVCRGIAAYFNKVQPIVGAKWVYAFNESHESGRYGDRVECGVYSISLQFDGFNNKGKIHAFGNYGKQGNDYIPYNTVRPDANVSWDRPIAQIAKAIHTRVFVPYQPIIEHVVKRINEWQDHKNNVARKIHYLKEAYQGCLEVEKVYHHPEHTPHEIDINFKGDIRVEYDVNGDLCEMKVDGLTERQMHELTKIIKKMAKEN